MRFIEVRTFLRIRSDSLCLCLLLLRALSLSFTPRWLIQKKLFQTDAQARWPDMGGRCAEHTHHTHNHAQVFFFANQIRKAATEIQIDESQA